MSKNEEKLSVDSKSSKNSAVVLSPTEFNTPATIALKSNNEPPSLETQQIKVESSTSKKTIERLNGGGSNIGSTEMLALSPGMNLEEHKSKEKLEPIEPSSEHKKGSIIGAALTQINICLGASIFTFGCRGKQFGLVWILIINFVCAFINFWSISRQVQGSEKLKENEYPEIVGKIFGKKMKNTFNILLIIFDLGILMTFLTIMYECLGRFVESIFFHGQYEDYDDFNSEYWGKLYFRFPIIFAIAFLMSLICLSRDMGKLSFMSGVAVGAVIYTMFIILIQVKGYYQFYKDNHYDPNDKNTHVNYIDISKAFTTKLYFFKGMSSLFYAYACHTGIYPIYNTFKPEKDGVTRMQKSTGLAVIVTGILHVIAITCGYLTEPVDPKNLIIYRKQKGTDYDILMNISKIAVAISIFFSGPPNYMSARISFEDVFLGEKISNCGNYILTFGLLAFCATISALYDKVLNYINYLGGFVAVFFSYLLPILIYIKSTGKGFTYWKNIVELSGAILLCIIGYIAGISTVIEDFSKE